MLLLVITIIMLVSLILPFIKRRRSSYLLVGLTTSLFIFWIGILTYIAKKGGFDKNLLWILFGSNAVRLKLQYLSITLGKLGYTIALGRYLFPTFLVLLASEYSHFHLAEKIKKYWWSLFIIPFCTLIVYIPKLFEKIINALPWALEVIVKFSSFWILSYLVLTIYIVIKEAILITMPFFRRRFTSKMCLLLSLAFLYALYSPQDPAQVYLFYRNDYMWMLGLWYLQKGFNLPFYTFVVIASIITASFGLWAMLKYTQIGWDDRHEEISLDRAAKGAQTGINMFSHGIKNELLANRILYTKLEALIKEDKDKETLLNSLTQLEQKNDALLSRIERLYLSSKHTQVVLSPNSLQSVVKIACDKFYAKYPKGEIENLVDDDLIVLCDKEHLSEALYNVIANGYECSHSPVKLFVNTERLWTNIVVKDNGPGIPKKMQKKIYTPFVSSKNSALNWGMGLYYSRDVVKSHLGYLRFETSNKGTEFYFMLPRYKEGRNATNKSIDC